MRSGGNPAERVDHGRKNHIPERSRKPLRQVRKRDPETGPQDFGIRPERLPFRRNSWMLPQRPGHRKAAVDKSGGAGPCRSFHPESGAGNGRFPAQDGNRPGRENQQEIQHHIDPVHRQSDPHRRPGIPRGPKNRSEQNGSRPEQHRKINDQKVAGRQIPDGRIHLHPYGNAWGGKNRQKCQKGTEQQGHGAGLAACLPGVFRPAGPHLSGNESQKAHPDSGNDAADHPVDRARSADGGCRPGSQRAYHCRINILHSGLRQLFQHGRPGQCENAAQHGTVKSAFPPHPPPRPPSAGLPE